MKKIAIEINNRIEHDAVVKNLKDKGYRYYTGVTPAYSETHKIITYDSHFNFISESNTFATAQYNIIPFSQFASIANIEIKTEIDVDLSPLISSISCKVKLGVVKFCFPKDNRSSLVLTKDQIDRINNALNKFI